MLCNRSMREGCRSYSALGYRKSSISSLKTDDMTKERIRADSEGYVISIIISGYQVRLRRQSFQGSATTYPISLVDIGSAHEIRLDNIENLLGGADHIQWIKCQLELPHNPYSIQAKFLEQVVLTRVSILFFAEIRMVRLPFSLNQHHVLPIRMINII